MPFQSPLASDFSTNHTPTAAAPKPKRNFANDFMRCKGRGILPLELGLYCAWRGIGSESKGKLHQALLSPAMGAKTMLMRYWHNGAILTDTFYMDVTWQTDPAKCPDLEELLTKNLDLFCGYAPFTHFLPPGSQADAGAEAWLPYSAYSKYFGKTQA